MSLGLQPTPFVVAYRDLLSYLFLLCRNQNIIHKSHSFVMCIFSLRVLSPEYFHFINVPTNLAVHLYRGAKTKL